MNDGNYKEYLKHKKQIGNYSGMNKKDKIIVLLYSIAFLFLILIGEVFIEKKDFKHNTHTNRVWFGGSIIR